MRLLVVALVVAALAATPAGAAAPPASFVLTGWSVARAKTTELDGDGVADRVLVLRRDRAGDGGSRPRRLVVLRGTGGGRFERAGEGRRILLCTRCGGALHGLRAPPVRLSVERGALVVRQESGAREVREQTFRLRLRDRAVTLIGYDQADRDRATGAVVETSTNLLTGERTVRTARPGREPVTRASDVGACTQPLRRVRLTRPLAGC